MALAGPYAPDTLGRPDNWRRRAECCLATASLFHPEYSGTGPRHAAEAKAICGRCGVRGECLAWALNTREPHGVWGGLDEAERFRLLNPPPGIGAADGGAETAPPPEGPGP